MVEFNIYATTYVFQVAKEELTAQSLQLVHSSKMLVIAMSDPTLPDLPENLAVCLTILRRLTELCEDLSNHTTAPLQTRNLIMKVHDVIGAFHHLITANIDRTSQVTIEEHLAAEAESLANVLTTLLRNLRIFSSWIDQTSSWAFDIRNNSGWYQEHWDWWLKAVKTKYIYD